MVGPLTVFTVHYSSVVVFAVHGAQESTGRLTKQHSIRKYIHLLIIHVAK